MKINVMTLLFFLSSTLIAQEDYGIRKKLNEYSMQEISSVVIKSINRSFIEYKKHRITPKAYVDKVFLENENEKQIVHKYFEKTLSRPLANFYVNKKSQFVFKEKGVVLKFTLKQLFKSKVSINGKIVKIPTGKTFEETIFLLNSEIQNSLDSKKQTSNFTLINSVYADEAELDDRKVDSLYKSDKYVKNQTTQGLMLSLLLLYKDIGITESGFISNRKLKKNLVNYYNKISELAKSCHEEKVDTNGKFRPKSQVVKNLKAIDLVNEEIHRKDMMRTDWSSEINVFVWTRLKYTFKETRKSYNICKNNALKKIYADDMLCKNLEKLTDCLVAFRSSGKISEKRMEESEMSDLFSEDKGIDDINNLMER